MTGRSPYISRIISCRFSPNVSRWRRNRNGEALTSLLRPFKIPSSRWLRGSLNYFTRIPTTMLGGKNKRQHPCPTLITNAPWQTFFEKRIEREYRGKKRNCTRRKEEGRNRSLMYRRFLDRVVGETLRRKSIYTRSREERRDRTGRIEHE